MSIQENKMETKYEGFNKDIPFIIQDVVSDSLATWSLSNTLLGVFFVLAFYLTMVLIILPNFMANRLPYKLKGMLLCYDFVQVLLSAYLVLIYSQYILKHGLITTRCPKGNDLLEVMQHIIPCFIAKHLDLLDTVFFVLRKKYNQKTFLHLYHHTTMVSWTWLIFMYYPTDHFVVDGLLNGFVHVLMYAYYGISSLGPEYSKYLWWKKHLTKVQLVQFILIVLDLFYQQKHTTCPIPEFFHYFCVSSNTLFFILFLNFYFRSYKNKKSSKQPEAARNLDD